MSSVAQNRATAIQFATTMKDHAGGADEELLTPDFIWYTPDQGQWSFQKLKAYILELRKGIMPELPTMEVVTTTAEDDRVSLELAGKCVLANGKRYDNFCHFLLWFRDGRICALKEYTDTKLAADLLWAAADPGIGKRR
jgi:ketosteroid isomerase-like protein